MSKLFSPEGIVIRVLNRMADMAVASVVWLLLSLPVVTLGNASYALRQTLRQEGPVVRCFWKTFCQDLKQGLLRTALLAGMAIALGAGFLLLGRLSLGIVMLPPFAVWLGTALYAFFLLPAGAGKGLRVAFVLSLRHLPVTLVMEMVLLVLAVVTEVFYPFGLLAPALFSLAFDKWFEKMELRYKTLIES